MAYNFPIGYKSKLSLRETMVAFNEIKSELMAELQSTYDLLEVNPPLFVKVNTGINETIGSIDRPVNFDIRTTDTIAEFLTSPIKWRRYGLYKFDVPEGHGIICNSNSIRRDTATDNTHSVLWDELGYEIIIPDADRNEEFLIKKFSEIYKILNDIEDKIVEKYKVPVTLPADVPIYTAQQLEDLYPSLTPKERETRVARKNGAFLLLGCGIRMNSGKTHGERPYDIADWNLSGELIVNFDQAKTSMAVLEISIKVDSQTLVDQSFIFGGRTSLKSKFHQLIIDNRFSPSFGCTIFKSRLAMLLLDKVHIAEVQNSVWSDDFEAYLRENDIDTF